MEKVKRMVEAFKYGLMDPDTMDFGEMEWQMAMVVSYMLKEMFMKVNGQRTKPTAMASILTLTEADTKASGLLTNNMDSV